MGYGIAETHVLWGASDGECGKAVTLYECYHSRSSCTYITCNMYCIAVASVTAVII